jgi:hypothetical protein
MINSNQSNLKIKFDIEIDLKTNNQGEGGFPGSRIPVSTIGILGILGLLRNLRSKMEILRVRRESQEYVVKMYEIH